MRSYTDPVETRAIVQTAKERGGKRPGAGRPKGSRNGWADKPNADKIRRNLAALSTVEQLRQLLRDMDPVERAEFIRWANKI